MKLKSFCLFLFFQLSFCAGFAQKAIELKIAGQINSVTAGYVQQGIEKAEKEKAEFLIIQLNTPGGLLDATREIVGSILSAPLPIIVYVAPEGAHAGSAGVFITLAAHLSVMAPGTNIGAAHPVSLMSSPDSIMNTKILNDATSFIKSIAEKRNKNWEWAVDAVQKSYSISAQEALEKNVIDLIAKSKNNLLLQIDQKTIQLNNKSVILNTKNVKIETFEMGSIDKILNIINDPNIMYVLLLIGIFGVALELFNPGAILPGIIGVICLILAFYAMSTLPVNYAGVALILFAIILFILEIKIISHGMLGLGGIISLLIGSLMLIRKDPSFDVVQISNWVIFTSVTLTALLFLVVIYMGLKAQKRISVSGSEGFIGKTGTVLESLSPLGLIQIYGEIWTAESLEERIPQHKKVQVIRMEGLKLFVKQVAD